MAAVPPAATPPFLTPIKNLNSALRNLPANPTPPDLNDVRRRLHNADFDTTPGPATPARQNAQNVNSPHYWKRTFMERLCPNPPPHQPNQGFNDQWRMNPANIALVESLTFVVGTALVRIPGENDIRYLFRTMTSGLLFLQVFPLPPMYDILEIKQDPMLRHPTVVAFLDCIWLHHLKYGRPHTIAGQQGFPSTYMNTVQPVVDRLTLVILALIHATGSNPKFPNEVNLLACATNRPQLLAWTRSYIQHALAKAQDWGLPLNNITVQDVLDQKMSCGFRTQVGKLNVGIFSAAGWEALNHRVPGHVSSKMYYWNYVIWNMLKRNVRRDSLDKLRVNEQYGLTVLSPEQFQSYHRDAWKLHDFSANVGWELWPADIEQHNGAAGIDLQPLFAGANYYAGGAHVQHQM